MNINKTNIKQWLLTFVTIGIMQRNRTASNINSNVFDTRMDALFIEPGLSAINNDLRKEYAQNYQEQEKNNYGHK